VLGPALAVLAKFLALQALACLGEKIVLYDLPYCSSRCAFSCKLAGYRWTRRKTSGAVVKILGRPRKWHVFFGSEEELHGTNCAVGLDLCQCLLSLHSPEPQRLANAVAVQRPRLAVADSEAFALDPLLSR
jgi:hypothetical protein